MITVSLCMIVKDEEDVIARCLDSVADLADELIVVDTGSTDRTVEIVGRYTDRKYTFAWTDDFAAARNYAFEQAAMDYILWLDADDVLTEINREKLRALKQTLTDEVDSVTMLYELAEDDCGNVTFQLRRNRLVKRSRGFRWIGAVHEYLEVGGTIASSDIAVKHMGKPGKRDSERNIRIYERRLAEGETLSPRDLYYYANELCDHGLHKKAITYYERFLNEGGGWIEDNISACGRLADCHHVLGDMKSELEASLRSLQFDAPRAEFCCRIGYHFLSTSRYGEAVFWYALATERKLPEGHLGFDNPACATWLPHLQLCVCYDKLGQHALAILHNDLALQYRPTDAVMLANRDYFARRLSLSTPDDAAGRGA
ncbi:glycosyltransferase family 2 protein [Cohnella sp. 56]|uniref:glycosyltransferase family 2 protein n=1 Tax=Cohnella sp. 56 TaxID=3113722 RepID=UPI0030E9F482